MLLQKDVTTINVKNVDGETPLHLASFFNLMKNVEVLLKYGADVNIRNNVGEFPDDDELTMNDSIRTIIQQHRKK